jgi:hypothetical protein
MRVRKSTKRRGIALIMVLLALLVLGTVAGGMVAVGSNHLMHAFSGNQTLEAQYAARAGAWIKLAQVRSGDLKALESVKMPSSGATYSATVTVGLGPGTPPFPPPDTYYVEGVGTSVGGKERRVGILATLSSSRWNHAIFGNNEVTMNAGSYTDSFNSDGGAVDHSKASVATNNSVRGVVIENTDSVVIGWANSTGTDGKPKKKKDESEVELDPKANAQGPPGSTENVTVKSKGKGKAYNEFVTGAQEANMDPVVLPTGLPLGTVGVIDPLVSPYPSVTTTAPTTIPPGAYHDLKVGSKQVAILDVSTLTPGSTAEYIFHSIDLQGGILQVQQPPTGKPVTVKVYIDTGKGTELDATAGLRMQGASLINPVAKPINLQFLVAGEGTISLEGHDDLKDGLIPTAYYVAYAPEANIEILRGQIFGAIVANNVLLDGESLTDPDKAPAVVHYDVTLLGDEENPPIFQVLSVRNY